MGARSFDDEIAQVPSRDGADRHFAANTYMDRTEEPRGTY